MYTFGAEGAREAMSKVWWLLIVIYILQVGIVKLRNKKPKLHIPHKSIEPKEQNGSSNSNRPVQKQPTAIPPIKVVPMPSSKSNIIPVQKQVPPAPVPKITVVKQQNEKKKATQSKTTKVKKIRERIDKKNF